MRLFTGIALAPDIARSVELLVDQLRPLANINWSPPGNYHVTTKFIGHWPEGNLPALDSALAAVPRRGGFEISVSGLGFFPHHLAPKVFFAGIVAPPALPALAQAIDEAAATAGCPCETRDYSPHLTLGRIEKTGRIANARLKNQNIARLHERLTPHMPAHNFGTFPVTEFHLYLSEPGPTGSLYTLLRTYPVC